MEFSAEGKAGAAGRAGYDMDFAVHGGKGSTGRGWVSKVQPGLIYYS
jgi:hypothetical protein